LKRAILIGNGVTSQLIEDYRDDNMIKKVKKELGEIFFEIDSLLEPYRELDIKDEQRICELLEKSRIERHHYKRYFLEQSLLDELEYPHISALETLLKVAHLFHHVKDFDYNMIKSCANEIYYNDGKNGIFDANKESIDINKFTNFINEFNYVFTTNFDNILDDVYKDEVYHLHVGFYYRKIRRANGEIYIVKEKTSLAFNEAYLIWGRNSQEKLNQTKAGTSFPMSFPTGSGYSILQKYINELENGSYEELHIWGYSGLNDNHINQSIAKNIHLKRVYCYVSPDDVDKMSVLQKMQYLYNFEKKHEIIVKSWNDIWSLLK